MDKFLNHCGWSQDHNKDYKKQVLSSANLRVIDIKQIDSVVAITPNFKINENEEIARPLDTYFILEKMGLNTTEEEEDKGPENDEGGTYTD
ncbi:hypothetical protein C0995_000482 [Termitomyces sp. Mi166|nr:hypothetical protein C0995_000482 [Termitomyces sp. Mi166\